MSNCPARAGFTVGGVWVVGFWWDHPRSRGVYTFIKRKVQINGGSSPLARGLPADRPRKGTFVGIIPARAGFTLASAVGFVEDGDHPRSRGVYRSVRTVTS